MAENVTNGSEAGGNKPSVRSPEIFDPYLGRVYGNVLDLYDTPTYTPHKVRSRFSLSDVTNGKAYKSGFI